MYRNFIKSKLSVIILFVISAKAQEDELLMKAILLEENLAFIKSADIYGKLYEDTNKKGISI